MGLKKRANAIDSGYLKILQFARMKGCPWNEQACSDAVNNGYLEVLQ